MSTFREMFLNEAKKITKKDFPKKIGEMELYFTNNPKLGGYFFEDTEKVEPGEGDYGDENDYNQGLTVSFEFEHDGQIIKIKRIGIYDLGRVSNASISKPYKNKKYETIEEFLKDMNEFWEKSKTVL